MPYNDTSELTKVMDEAVEKSNKIVNMMKKDHGHDNGYLVVEYTHCKPKDSIWYDRDVCLYWTPYNLQKEGMRSGDKIILGITPTCIVKDEQWELRIFKEIMKNYASLRSGYVP